MMELHVTVVGSMQKRAVWSIAQLMEVREEQPCGSNKSLGVHFGYDGIPLLVFQKRSVGILTMDPRGAEVAKGRWVSRRLCHLDARREVETWSRVFMVDD